MKIKGKYLLIGLISIVFSSVMSQSIVKAETMLFNNKNVNLNGTSTVSVDEKPVLKDVIKEGRSITAIYQAPEEYESMVCKFGLSNSNLNYTIFATKDSNGNVSCQTTGLTPNTSYYFKLILTNGTNKVESDVDVITTENVILGKSKYITSSVAKTHITAKFSLVENARSYKCYLGETSNNLNRSMTPSIVNDQLSCYFDGLSTGKTYYFQVSASDDLGQTTYSDIQPIKTYMEQATAATFIGSEVSYDKIYSSWTLNGYYTEQVCLASIDGKNYNIKGNFGSHGTNGWCMFTGLKPNTKYYVKLMTINELDSKEKVTQITTNKLKGTVANANLTPERNFLIPAVRINNPDGSYLFDADYDKATLIVEGMMEVDLLRVIYDYSTDTNNGVYRSVGSWGSYFTKNFKYGAFYILINCYDEKNNLIGQYYLDENNERYFVIAHKILIKNVYNSVFSGKEVNKNDALYKEMQSILKNKGLNNTLGVYNLIATVGTPKGKINLTIAVDSIYNNKTVTVINKKKNGNVEQLSGVVKNGKLNVSISELGTIILGTKSNPNVSITGVKINQKNPTVMVGKTTKLTATINPGNTTQSKKLTWSISNKKIATVDKNGVVKGIKAGTATITVKTSNGKKATVKVTVKKPTPIKSVKLNKKTLKLELGKTATVKATINPSNTTDSKKLTWSSSNKKVAVVDKNGKITAKAAGTAKITVKTVNGKKATVKVTVSKISAKKAKILAIKNQVQNGKALKPAVTVKLGKTTLKNGRDYTVSYKNNKNAGKATVTVKFKGNYTGTKSTTFLIIPSKVNIKKPSTSKKAITVKYSKVSGAKTYQIAYRLKGTKKWSYTTSKSSSKKISKLTSGKEYEVIVRAGIKNGSKTLYGSWSNTKVIKVK